MPKEVYPLKPCPWCKKTPIFKMYYGSLGRPEQTYMPRVYCDTCNVKCEGKYVPIRKRQRENPQILREKIEKCISYWNTNNDYCASEGIELDFEEIAKEYSIMSTRTPSNN